MKKNILGSITVILSCFIGIYIIEIILTGLNSFNHPTAKSGYKDHRSEYQVYQDSKNNNRTVYPWVGPRVTNDGGKLLAISGISNTLTIFCNEEGDWKIYKSDKFGFNNDNNNYEKKVNALIIGDSFAEGSCVDYEDSFQGYFSKNKINSISLGKGGNSTFFNFVALREFVDLLKPNFIFWFHYVNDIEDMKMNLSKEEIKNILYRYLDNPNYSQNLINKQYIVDRNFINLINKMDKKISRKPNFKTKFKYSKTRRILTLYYVRMIIRSFFIKHINNDEEDEYFNLFEKIIKESKEIADKNSSKFIFVYLPWQNAYKIGETHRHKKNIQKIILKKNIEFVDIDILFRKHKNPLDFYTNVHNIHFNKKGFNLISENLIKNYFD